MRIALAVKSHNPMAHMRMSLLESCLRSAEKAFPRCEGDIRCEHFLFMNGCDDGSELAQSELAEQFGFHWVSLHHNDDNYTPGAGAKSIGETLSFRYTSFNICAPTFQMFDVVVFSDDDMIWRPGAAEIIEHVMLRKPDRVKIVSGLLEPEWKWNTPRYTAKCGRHNILVRDSCPGAAWIFRVSDWQNIGPRVKPKFGYDYDACTALVMDGFEVAQVDLAEHAGWGASTHGNEAINTGKPLDRDRWGV